MVDPYRDSLENQVRRNSERIDEMHQDLSNGLEKLEKRINNAKLVPSIWGSTKSVFYNMTHWKGWGDGGGLFALAIIGIAAALIFGAPACLQSCEETPEQARASEEARKARVEEQQASCQAMGMEFVEWDNGTKRLTCANQQQVAVIDINDNELTVHPIRREQ
jgi:hypothetical protein